MTRLLLVWVVFSIAACGGKPAFQPPKLESLSRVVDVQVAVEPIVLENGLIVFLMPDPSSNFVRLDARYVVGADQDSVAGLAHVVEHASYLLSDDTNSTLGDRLDRAAIEYNALTSWDLTHYHASALPNQLPELLKIEAQRLRGCGELDEATLAREKEVVRSELRTRADVSAPVFAELFGKGPRDSWPLGGTESSVASIDKATVCSFLERFYQPKRALLVVSGAFQPDAAKSYIEAEFAALGSKSKPVPRLNGQGRVLKPGTGKLELPVENPALLVAFNKPRGNKPAAVAARLIAAAASQEIAQLEKKHRWIEDVTIGTADVGSAGLFLFVIELETAERFGEARKVFDDAINAFRVRLARDSPRRFDPDVLLLDTALQFRRRQLISSIRTLEGRAMVTSDRFHYDGHRYGVTPELRTLSSLTRATIDQAAEVTLVAGAARYLEISSSASGEKTSLALGALSRPADGEHAGSAMDTAASSQPMKLSFSPPVIEDVMVRF